MEVLRDGIIQYVSQEHLIVSKGNILFKSDDSGKSWKKWCSLPLSNTDKILGINRWFSRLSRKEVHHLLKIKADLFVCFAFGKIYLIEDYSGNTEYIGKIKGSRPLRVCTDGENLYYGVYTGNEKRRPVNLFSYSIEKNNWTIYHTFKNIRHIHGVFWDKYSSSLWLTTGDKDHESVIWRFGESGKPEKIVDVSQQTRAVDLIFTEKSIFYATDAPLDPNYIYRTDRESGTTHQLQKIGGPVFYGRKEGGWLFFSTVVEPSDINRTDAVELWGSNDSGKKWKKIKEFKKDIAPMKLFQYGQIKFPNGPGDRKNFWFTPYAVDYDHQVIKLSIDSIYN